MSIAIVQGGSKGIGFQLAKLFLQHTDLKVIATARTSANWTESLKANNLENSDRFQFLPMDVTSEVSIKECFDTIQATHGKDSVRYFVNSAGFLKPEKSLAQIDIDNTHQHFNVNVIGPMLIAKHFSKLLANPKKTENQVAWINISAKTGSITDNGLGGWHSYRISKAALNQLTKTMSVELGRKGVQVMSLHPGTVDTDLSRPYTRNTGNKVFTPAESAEKMFNVFSKSKENGVFLNHDGTVIPW